MKNNNFLEKFIYFLIGLFLFLNCFYFYSSIKISDEINKYENQLTEIENENLKLEKKLITMSSLEYAYKAAEKLGFEKKPKTIYFENLIYAYKNNQ